jgi:putative ABC transport system permease protein
VDRFGIITSNDQWVKAQKRPLLTMDEFEYLRDNMKTANAVAALDDRTMDLKAGNERLERTDVMGVTANYTDVRNIGVAQGRMITESDDVHRSQVVFIGADVVAKLFSNVDPIGKTLRAETHEYQVIGVATPIGSAFGQSQDNFVIMPIHTYQREFHKQNDWVGIFVQSPSSEMMDPSKDEARMLMRARRHLPYDAPDNFAILGSDSIMALWHQLTGTLATVAVGLVSVFLVVGGIVIMNIMLASVTERTREIGVRRSLGARKIHIMLQFMTESGVLAAVGGVMGLIAAYALVTLGRTLTSIPMQMPLGAVVLSLLVSTAVGLFFGIYPAMRAAKLDPIEALRADG